MSILPESFKLKGVELSARIKKVDKDIFGDSRDKQLPVPLASPGAPTKEFNDVLYRCFVPEEKQKRNKRNLELVIDIDKESGWDKLFSEMYKILYSIESIKVRHRVLLNVVFDFMRGRINYYESSEMYSTYLAYVDGNISKNELIKLIQFTATNHHTYTGTYSYLTSKAVYDAVTGIGSKGFLDYRETMRSFMASDSSFFIKKVGTEYQIIWSGDGGTVLPPEITSLSSPSYYSFKTKDAFKAEVAGMHNTSDIIKNMLSDIYGEIYDSFMGFVQELVPGFDTNLHSKVRKVYPLDVKFSASVSSNFKDYLIQPHESLSIDPTISSTRKKYLSLSIQRHFNAKYIDLARALNAQNTALNVNDRVRFSITDPETKEIKECIGTMRPFSRNKNKLSINYNGNELKIKDVTNLRLFVSDRVDELAKPEAMALTAIQASLQMHIVQVIPEFFVRAVTQTPTGKISLGTLRTWLMIWQRLKFKNSKEFKRVPKYVLPYSQLTRAEMFKNPGDVDGSERTDDYAMTVDNVGKLIYVPKISEDFPARYEEILDNLLEQAYANDEPFNIERVTSQAIYKINKTTEEIESRAEGIETLRKFKLLPLACNWNTNVVLYPGIGKDLNVVKATSLDGAMTPDSRTMADWMGMPTKDNGKYPSGKPGMRAYAEMIGFNGKFDYTQLGDVLLCVETFYYWLLLNDKVPTYQQLYEKAKAHLSTLDRSELITELDDPYIYSQFLKNGEMVYNDLGPVSNPRPIGINLLKKAFEICSSSYRLKDVAKTHGIDITEHPCYLNSNATFTRINEVMSSMLGGCIWIELCREITKFLVHQKDLEDLVFNGIPIEQEDYMTLLCYDIFSERIVPQAKIWGEYLPNSDDILIKAHEYKKTLSKVDNYVPVVPGVKEIDPNDPDKKGFALQPHQMDTMCYSAAHPKYMILDIAPGGGKTILGLTEILIYLSEKRIKRPLVIMPINLIKNWINDCINALKAPVNFIVISSETVRQWGRETLGDKIRNAPPNTIVCTSYNWLYNKSDTNIVMYGIKPVKLFGNIEFLKQFSFDYIACDEAHRLKNAGLSSGKKQGKPTSTHLAVLRLVSCKSVKYVRLLTGTLIKNTLLDLVGQVRLLNPAIFRTVDAFKDDYGDPNTALNSEDGRKVQQEIRKYLQEFVTVVQKKKRHWAFVMPEFEDRFDFVDPDDVAQEYYEWVLGKTLEEIEASLGSDSKDWKLLTGGVAVKSEEDDDDDSEDTTDDSSDDSNGGDEENGLDSDSDSESDDADPGESALTRRIEAALKPYLARLEQALSDPEGDPEFEEFQEAMVKDGRHIPLSPSAKLNKIYSLLDQHFEGHVEIDKETGDIIEEVEPMCRLDSPENKDKVLIFSSYHRSIQAIFKHLPDKYKKYARMYHAGTPQVLEEFIHDPQVKILVALEKSIQEGHNLQVASRLIRAEQVWTPGEMDQAVSRVHRPDIGNKYGRKKIIHNWIIVNNTLEVAKLGRLIAKFVSKAKFDEPDLRYQNLQDLRPIRMALPIISGRNPDGTPNEEGKKNYRDIVDYLEAYGMDPENRGNIRGLAQFQQEDFEDERVKAMAEGRDKMVPVKSMPMMEGSMLIKNLPYVMGQSVYDPDSLGLIPMIQYLEQHPELKVTATESLKGLPVHTEMGEGIIQSIKEVKKDFKRRKGEDGKKTEKTKGTVVGYTFKIRLGNGGFIDGYKWSKTFVITNLSTNTKKLLKKAMGENTPDTKPTESPKAAAMREKLKRLQQKKEETDIPSVIPEGAPSKPGRKKKTVIEETPTGGKRTIVIERTPDGKKRTTIVEEEPSTPISKLKPVKQPKVVTPVVEKTGKTPKNAHDVNIPVEDEDLDAPFAGLEKKQKGEKPKADKINSLEVFAVESNGVPTLLLSHNDPDSATLGRKLGFNYFGSYIYTEIKNQQIFEMVMQDLVAQGFELSNVTQTVFNKILRTFKGIQNKQKAFVTMKNLDKRLLFDPNRKRPKTKNPNLLRIYPIIENGDTLCLYVDTSTADPAAMRLKRMKKLPNVPQAKWLSASGIWVYQGKTKATLLKKLNDFAKAGVTVENIADVKDDIEALF